MMMTECCPLVKLGYVLKTGSVMHEIIAS